MAWDPCHLCLRPFRGQSVYTYIAWPIAGRWFRFRLRSCQDCADQFRIDSVSLSDWKNSEGEWEQLDLVSPIGPRVIRLERSRPGRSAARSVPPDIAASDRSGDELAELG